MTVLSVELFIPPDVSEILLRVYRHFPPIIEKADDAVNVTPGQVLGYNNLRSFQSALGHKDILASTIRSEFHYDGLWLVSTCGVPN